MDYASRVRQIYTQCNPAKLADVDQLMQTYAGREAQLIESLEKKYAAELQQQQPQALPVDSSSSPTVPRVPATEAAASLQPPSPAPAAPSVIGSAAPPTATAAASSPGPIPPSQPSAAPSDTMGALRAQVRTDFGFLTKEHEVMWEDAWLGRLPLGTLQKTWSLTGALLTAATGLKLSTHARPVQRWQRRFFALAPPFLYYFASDNPTTPCKGALYLDRAAIRTETINERRAIVIQSRLTKKPAQLVHGSVMSRIGSALGGSGAKAASDFSTFVFFFEDDRLHQSWMGLLQQVSRLGDVGSSSKSFGAYPIPGQALIAAIGSGAVTSGSITPAQLALLTGQSALQPPPGVTLAQFQQMQMERLSSLGFTANNLAMGGGGGMAAAGPAAISGASAGGGGGSPTGATSRDGHPAGVFGGGGAYGGGFMGAGGAFTSRVSVDVEEIKRRLARLAADRDPILIGHVFIDFVTKYVDNATLLWQLMATIENDIEPFKGPTFAHAQAALLHQQRQQQWGYGGGMGMGTGGVGVGGGGTLMGLAPPSHGGALDHHLYSSWSPYGGDIPGLLSPRGVASSGALGAGSSSHYWSDPRKALLDAQRELFSPDAYLPHRDRGSKLNKARNGGEEDVALEPTQPQQGEGQNNNNNSAAGQPRRVGFADEPGEQRTPSILRTASGGGGTGAASTAASASGLPSAKQMRQHLQHETGAQQSSLLRAAMQAEQQQQQQPYYNPLLMGPSPLHPQQQQQAYGSGGGGASLFGGSESRRLYADHVRHQQQSSCTPYGGSIPPPADSIHNSSAPDHSYSNTQHPHHHHQRYDEGGVTTPLPTAAMPQRPQSTTRPVLGAYSSGSGGSGGSGAMGGGVDDEWARRLGRIRDRKHLIERLVTGLPPN